MANKKMNSFLKVISYLLIVLVLVAVIGAIAFFTNGFSDDFKTFYAVIDDTYVMTTASGYKLSVDEPLSVDVKYTFNSLSAEKKGYSLAVVPNVDYDSDFDFFVNDLVRSFRAESDLIAGFDIEYEESSFKIAPKGSIEDIMSAVYPDDTITINKGSIDFTKDLFKIVITSYDGEASVYVTFGIYDHNVTGVSLDITEIVF